MRFIKEEAIGISRPLEVVLVYISVSEVIDIDILFGRAQC